MKNLFKALGLQFFNDAGTKTNVGYATDSSGHASYSLNSYTGSVDTYDSNNSFAPELKSFYETEMMENYRVERKYGQFAKKVALPNGHGTSMEFRKWNTFARAGKLQEGVIPLGQKWGATSKTASIDQYGTYVTLSDKLKRHTFDDAVMGAYEEMGASAAETEEALTRDALLINTNVIYCDNITLSTGAVDSTPTSNAGMYANSTKRSMLTATMVNKAKTKLVKDRVKPFMNGKFYAVIHPSVAFDLRESNGWIEAHKYAAVDEIFNGEIGELHGVRFIEDVFAPIFRGADLEGDAAYLTVDTTGSDVAAQTGTTHTSVLPLTTTLTSAEQTAIAGRKIIVGGTVLTVHSAKDADELYIQGPNPAIDVSALSDTKAYPGEGAGEGVAAYATYFFGKDAFVQIDAEGGGLEMITHDQGEIGGPLNQFSTIGYKFDTNGATVLYPERVLRVMSCSSYASVDTANP